MLTAYLWFNAALYLVFSAWCALAPRQTSEFLGLARTNAAGESEYLAVYGGLQAGLAVFYALAALDPTHRRSALLFSLVLYGGIVAFRSIAIVRLGFNELGNARFAYGLELAMLVAAVFLFLRTPR